MTPRNVPPPEDIAARLRQLREEAEQGQEEFAARWRIPARTYQTYERAESWLSCAFLRELAKAGINVNWLLTGVGDTRAEQPLRLHKGMAGALDHKGKFKPLPAASDADLQHVQEETAALWRRLNRPAVMAEMAGIDGDLAHRLADMHADNVGRAASDNVAPLLALVAMLDEAYRAAELQISSADVGRIAADEYRAIYEAGESADERLTADKAVQVRHMRAAAWAKNTLLKDAPAGRQK